MKVGTNVLYLHPHHDCTVVEYIYPILLQIGANQGNIAGVLSCRAAER